MQRELDVLADQLHTRAGPFVLGVPPPPSPLTHGRTFSIGEEIPATSSKPQSLENRSMSPCHLGRVAACLWIVGPAALAAKSSAHFLAASATCKQKVPCVLGLAQLAVKKRRQRTRCTARPPSRRPARVHRSATAGPYPHIRLASRKELAFFFSFLVNATASNGSAKIWTSHNIRYWAVGIWTLTT